MSTLSIGSDPEFFVQDSKGNLKSAIDLIEGTKHMQQAVARGGLQHDNVAAEYSHEPVTNEDDFVQVHKDMLVELVKHLKGNVLSSISSTEFPEEQLENEEAFVFGCDPDFSCWTASVNFIDPEAPFLQFRSAGGHIHVGHLKEFPKTLSEDTNGSGRIEMTKAMDVFVGLPSVLLDNGPESKKRRTLYGKAGAHRPKPYGIEYRTLSNFWVMAPELTRLVYQLTISAAEAADDGIHTQILSKVGEEELQRIINECDVEAAQSVFDEYIKEHLEKSTVALLENSVGKTFNPMEAWGLSPAKE